MSANSSNTLDIVRIEDRSGRPYAFLVDGTAVPVSDLNRQNLLKAAKVQFPSTNGKLWFRVKSADIVSAISTGEVPDVVTGKSESGWDTEPPTDKQLGFLKGLCQKHGETFVAPATKAEASEWIDRLNGEDEPKDVIIEEDAPPTKAAAPSGDVEAAIRALVEASAPRGESVDVETVRAVVEAELNQRLLPTTIEVRSGDEVRRIEGHTHKVLPKVLTYLSRGYHVLLVGPAGSGKSTIAEQAFAALGHDGSLPAISFGPTTPTSKLFGYNDANGRYNGTPYRQAFENGTPFLGDELDNGHPGLTAELNQSLANGHGAFADGTVKRAPGFVFIGTANTYGRGGDRLFVGRNQLDAATLDRFKIVHVDYDEALESSIAFAQVSEADRPKAEAFIAKVRKHRKNVLDHKLPVVVSPRSVIDGCDLVCNAGLSPDEVIEDSYLGGLSPDLRAKVTA